MTDTPLRFRILERGTVRARWEQPADPDDSKVLRRILLTAIAELGEPDPVEVLGRFALEWQARTGGWRTFRDT